MAIRTEHNLTLPTSPGALAGVCRLLSTERVNILTMALDSGGQLRLVVANHVHGGSMLREHHHQVAERDVIIFVHADQARHSRSPAHVMTQIRQLVVRMATENREWGYTRIRGALANLNPPFP